MGRQYAANRNSDAGAGSHAHVSCLSPYIRHRLVTERELAAAALETHGPEAAEKFVQEVFWRGYFKGWLENRPSIWAAYRAGLDRDLGALAEDPSLRSRVAAAETGRTGLECFDCWANELRQTGYLHNHARMWFASIWIFTFELPWRIGADFFLRHLIDGDPASNTLGWRWVAGLHTRGKAYEARASNIARFTNGRFRPRASDLASDVTPLDSEEPDGLPPVEPIRSVEAPAPGRPAALLITGEDCCLEDFDLSALDIRACATLSGSHLRSPRPVADAVSVFETSALADAAHRLSRPARPLKADTDLDLADWARSAGAEQIVTPYVPEGPLRDWLAPRMDEMARGRMPFREVRRSWDSLLWPHATAGYFKVRKRIPDILSQTGVG